MKFVPELPEAIAGRRPKYITETIRQQLESQPGAWALLDFDTARAANAIRTWTNRHDNFESRVRVKDGSDNAWNIYVRYTGEA